MGFSIYIYRHLVGLLGRGICVVQSWAGRGLAKGRTPVQRVPLKCL